MLTRVEKITEEDPLELWCRIESMETLHKGMVTLLDHTPHDPP